MITSWQIYWITRLDSLNVALAIIWIALAIASVAMIIGAFVYSLDDELEQYPVGVMKKITITTVAVLLLSIFIPSTKEVAAIYLIPKIANNEQVQKLPENFVKLLNVKMEQWMNNQIDKKKK